jgi:hypothetical protein
MEKMTTISVASGGIAVKRFFRKNGLKSDRAFKGWNLLEIGII